jgi:hypothetical protein
MLAPSHLRANKGQNGSQPRIGKEENHMTKSLLLIATLALAGIASAKTYDNMVIPAPTLVSGQEMAAGEYSIQLKGDTAVFTSIDTDRSYTASVKVESSAKKFDRTAVDCDSKSGAQVIEWIRLGGSNTTIQFEN